MKTKLNKNSIKLVVALAALLGAGLTAQAQTTNTIVTKFESATNWAGIPYFSYDTTTKKYGGGVALLYAVNQYTWVGVRAQSINGQQTTAGVQAQLQVSETVDGVKLVPFIVANTGMGNSSLYASGGTGGLISFHEWELSKTVTLEVGVVGDYEHYVYGSKNGNQVNAGPLIHLSF